MAFCLTKPKAEAFRQAIRNGRIDPFKMATLSSKQIRELLTPFVGAENAKQVNALYESKLLLKNKQRGYITWVKKITGISQQVKRDLISRIERMKDVLDPAKEQRFLEDLAEAYLRIGVTEQEARTISRMSEQVRLAREKALPDGRFTSSQDRYDYGKKSVMLEEYVNEKKLQSRTLSFREEPLNKIISGAKELPAVAKSLVASIDNSFFGLQGIKQLLNPQTTDIWVRTFVHSIRNITRVLRGYDAMSAAKADIYSRPNALNGKYKAGNYQLDVLSEEAYPSPLPGKIPLLGRLFKASEVAYNAGALEMRADVADRLIERADTWGVNTLNRDEAKHLGHLVGALTGRGSIGFLTPEGQRRANVLFFSIKFLKSNIDTLVTPLKYVAKKAGLSQFENKGQEFAYRESAKTLANITLTLSAIYMLAGALLGDDSVDLDPRSTNFGKVKLFGRWTDITGGMAGLVRLAAYVTPTKHDGKWSLWRKSSTGNWTDMRSGEYGVTDAWDTVLDSLIDNKLSPAFGLLRDAIVGEFYGGEKFTTEGAVKQSVTPLFIQTTQDLLTDPGKGFIFGSIILEGLGFSVDSYPKPNKESKAIPEGEKISKGQLIDTLVLYGRAMKADPETAWNRIFTGQTIVQVSDGGIVVVARQEVEKSQAYKKQKYGSDITEVRLDHVVPNKLGGSETPDNWRVVPISVWRSTTQVENALIRAVKADKIKLKEAQRLIKELKKKQGNKNNDSEDYKDMRRELLKKYK